MLSLCLSVLVILPLPLQSVDPLTIGAVGAVALGAYFKEHTYCRFAECCDDRNIPARIDGE